MFNLISMDVSAFCEDALFTEKYELLSEYRRKKIDAFRFRKDKNLSLGAGVLLDAALKGYGLTEREMIYGETGNHKPVFLNAPEIHFNISHSGTMVILAVSDAPVGCDIEKTGKADLKISRRFFTENEHARLLELSEGPQDELFYRLWTMKESYMKFTGEGMHLSLSDFEIDLTEEIPFVRRLGVRQDCRLQEIEEFTGYRCAVCC